MNGRSWLKAAGCCSLWALTSCIPDGAPAASAAAVNSADGKKCGADGVIDDSEDQNNQITTKKGRGGYWYVFADKLGSTTTPDGSGTFAMTAGGASGSSQAARVSGKVGTGEVVFAGMGFNFLDPKGLYDATAYKGIAFWAKVGGGSVTRVRLKIPGVDTDPDGKVCKACFNDFGIDLDLTPTWTRYVVPFSGATQLAGWGTPRPEALNPAKIYGIQWQVNSPGSSYDIWIDDVEFTGCP